MDKKTVGGGLVVVSTVILLTGVLYLVKIKKKSKKENLQESMEIIEESLENKNWWLTKECQTRSHEIIEWVKGEKKRENPDEKLEEALKVIEQEHWMTKKYQSAFRVVYNWAKTRMI